MREARRYKVLGMVGEGRRAKIYRTGRLCQLDYVFERGKEPIRSGCKHWYLLINLNLEGPRKENEHWCGGWPFCWAEAKKKEAKEIRWHWSKFDPRDFSDLVILLWRQLSGFGAFVGFLRNFSLAHSPREPHRWAIHQPPSYQPVFVLYHQASPDLFIYFTPCFYSFSLKKALSHWQWTGLIFAKIVV